jgi:hypothetical protein
VDLVACCGPLLAVMLDPARAAKRASRGLRCVDEQSRTQGESIAVGVAERLRRQVVALEIEGSNPSVHPIPS